MVGLWRWGLETRDGAGGWLCLAPGLGGNPGRLRGAREVGSLGAAAGRGGGAGELLLASLFSLLEGLHT